MSELKSSIESKITQLQEQAKKQNSDLISFANAKAAAEKNLSIIDGAIQAYQDTLNWLERADSDASVATDINSEESNLSG